MKKAIIALVLAAGLTSLAGNAKADLLSPVGTVWQSSQYNSALSATNLFYSAENGLTTNDFGTMNHLSVQYAASDTGGSPPKGDANPIVAFDLGSNATVSSFGYAQRTAVEDGVASISLWSLTQSQYATYTSLYLQTAPQSGGSSGTSAPAPTSFNYYSGAIAVSDADRNFNQYSISSSTTGEYWVVQFTAIGSPIANAGGFAFNLVGTTAVPEPSTYALFGLGVIGMLMALRRKKTA